MCKFWFDSFRLSQVCVCVLGLNLIHSHTFTHPTTGYKRNIHSIADLMILTKSNTFIGEFSSNWGRIVRIFRAQINDMYVIPEKSSSWVARFFGSTANYNSKETMTEPPVLIHDIRMAYGEEKAVPPPGW